MPCKDLDIRACKITPEKSIKEGRPDIEIDGGPGFTVLIEAKIQARLTPNQPKAYLNHLQKLVKSGKKQNAVLVFLHWYSKIDDLRDDVMRSLAGSNIPVYYISWEDIADKFFKEIKYLSPENSLRSFEYEFAQLIHGQNTRSINEPLKEVEKMILSLQEQGEAMAKTFKLVKDLKDILKSQKLKGKKALKVKDSKGEDYIGISFMYGKFDIYIGFWAYAWAQYGKTPVWLQFYGRQDYAEKLQDLGALADPKYGTLVPLEFDVDQESDQIKNWIKKIEASIDKLGKV